MKRIALLVVLTLTFQIIPPASGALKSCKNPELISLNKLAIEYNDNRSNFLKLLIVVNRSNDGILKSRNDRDPEGEAAWRKNYDDARAYALDWAKKGLLIEKNIRNSLGKCKSGYGLNYSSDFGLIAMNKTIKGISFPLFKIPALVVMPIVSSTSSAPTPRPSSPSNTVSELVLIPVVPDDAKWIAQTNRLVALNQVAAQKYTCVPYQACQLGSLGPGGGVVFYDACFMTPIDNTCETKSWGRYLEVAPFAWDPRVQYGNYEPGFVWCVPKSEDIKSNAEKIFYKTEFALGNGPRNTQILVDNCSSGAGNTVRNYQGGGKSDWYLPTGRELLVLDDFVKREQVPYELYDRVRTYLSDGKYWSSNCSFAGYGCRVIDARNFIFHEDVIMKPLTMWEKELGLVRPVRAF